MTTKREREIKWAMDFRRELTRAKLSRRDLMKFSALGSGAALLNFNAAAAHAAGARISPYTEPFMDPLPIPGVLQPVDCATFADHGSCSESGHVSRTLDSKPVKKQHDPTQSEWQDKFQYVNRFKPKKFYVLPTKEYDHKWHSGLSTSKMWGHGACFPGCTIVANYGEPIVVRHTNELPDNPTADYGIPQVITHLHNFHSGSENDGGPWNMYDRRCMAEPNDQPWFRDHYYTMARAGFTNDADYANYYGSKSTKKFTTDWAHYSKWADKEYLAKHYDSSAGNWGDPAETLNTMFYHSHRPDFTTSNVYKGQAGLFIARDELDTGNELTGLRFPSGEYDIPLVCSDKVFDANGQLFFDTFNLDGIIGDKPTVNGVIQPYLTVARRRYRFRFLNTGPSRILQHYLFNQTTGKWLTNPFLQIASDGNLLNKPVLRGFIQNSVAERYDVLVDFFKIAKEGDVIILYNRAEQKDGRLPTGKLMTPGIAEMKFIVGAPAADNSIDYFLKPASILRPMPVMDLTKVVQRRTFRFERSGGSWAINGKIFEPSKASSQAIIQRNTAEVWTLENKSGGWVHPVHVHFEEGRIMTRNGVAPPVYEQGRKDLYHLNTNEQVQVFFQFRDFPDPAYNPPNPAYKPEAGRYAMHCHNTVHEDHAMMCRWDINP